MSNNPRKKNALSKVQNADRNRKIFIQVAVAAVLIGLIAAIGIGIAVKKAKKDDPGPTPAITAAAGADGIAGSITDTGAIRIGKPGAKVNVRVVADLQCPACQGFEAANAQVLDDSVKNGTAAVDYNIIAFLDRASGGTEYSSRAANAAYVVAESDPAKFQGWLQAMFKQQPKEGGTGLTDDQIVQITKEAGYTDPAVAKAITDRKYDKYIKAKTNEVLNSGIQSTPSVFVNGKQIQSSQEVFGPNGLAPAIAQAAGQQ